MKQNDVESLEVTTHTEPLSVGYFFKGFIGRYISNNEISTCMGIVCCELASNIIKYGNQGTITCKLGFDHGKWEIEITAQDTGSGIDNIEYALMDGFSDKGPILTDDGNHNHTGLGAGLPAIKRFMDEIEIKSRKNQGTIITARKKLTTGENIESH
jgi:serine/threonine-protein kinase RsbT